MKNPAPSVIPLTITGSVLTTFFREWAMKGDLKSLVQVFPEVSLFDALAIKNGEKCFLGDSSIGITIVPQAFCGACGNPSEMEHSIILDGNDQPEYYICNRCGQDSRPSYHELQKLISRRLVTRATPVPTLVKDVVSKAPSPYQGREILVNGLNAICERNSDDFTALAKLFSKRVNIHGETYTVLKILHIATGWDIRPETPGGGDNSLLGFV